MSPAVDSSAALTGLRVLVTRPQHQAEKWQRYLESLGARTLRAPLLEILPFSEADGDDDAIAAVAAIKRRIEALDSYHHLIFVSQNAVRYGCSWIHRAWPELPATYQGYAVGAATAALLRQEGLTVIGAEGAMNSEALLALPQLQDICGQRALIFRGQGGRPVLAEKLQQRGAQVDYCELYRRVLPGSTAANLAASDFGAHPVGAVDRDLVAVHSGESLENWHRIITTLGKPHWLELPLLVPGERVAELARQLKFSSIIAATNATDNTMAEALINWYQQLRQQQSPKD